MRIYGLLGEALSHSLSPEIHRFLFRQLNIEAAYSLFPLPPARLAAGLEGLRLLGAGGVNVTIPYKAQIMPLLDDLSAEARLLGAVNTVLFGSGGAIGYNTDYGGFGLMLRLHQIEAAGKSALVLGTGGAARTAACWLRDHGAASVRLVSRQPGSKGDFAVLSYAQLAALPAVDILVNATPVGMHPYTAASPLPQELLPRFGVIIDLVYNPAETRLMREGREQGVRAINGLAMLAAQAVAAEEIWQGRDLSGLLPPLCDFLAVLPPPRNLVLLGLPGSGKTLLGQLAAARLGWEFCDIDAYIERRSGQSAGELAAAGTDRLRRLELEASREFGRRRRTVIAASSGSGPEALAGLAAGGHLVYLDRSLLPAAADGRQEQKALYERCAHCRVRNDSLPQQAVDAILAGFDQPANTAVSGQ
ncbi:MAG: shikimate kinase [Sporomusaceae bacterium]|nr:shikimate kinase [Sporomusaceae bacterium]